MYPVVPIQFRGSSALSPEAMQNMSRMVFQSGANQASIKAAQNRQTASMMNDAFQRGLGEVFARQRMDIAETFQKQREERAYDRLKETEGRAEKRDIRAEGRADERYWDRYDAELADKDYQYDIERADQLADYELGLADDEARDAIQHQRRLDEINAMGEREQRGIQARERSKIQDQVFGQMRESASTWFNDPRAYSPAYANLTEEIKGLFNAIAAIGQEMDDNGISRYYDSEQGMSLTAQGYQEQYSNALNKLAKAVSLIPPPERKTMADNANSLLGNNWQQNWGLPPDAQALIEVRNGNPQIADIYIPGKGYLSKLEDQKTTKSGGDSFAKDVIDVFQDRMKAATSDVMNDNPPSAEEIMKESIAVVGQAYSVQDNANKLDDFLTKQKIAIDGMAKQSQHAQQQQQQLLAQYDQVFTKDTVGFLENLGQLYGKISAGDATSQEADEFMRQKQFLQAKAVALAEKARMYREQVGVIPKDILAELEAVTQAGEGLSR